MLHEKQIKLGRLERCTGFDFKEDMKILITRIGYTT